MTLFAGSWITQTESHQVVPREWRFPTENELIKNWKWTKQETQKNLKVIGDFDGDRVVDEARLMIKKDFSAMGLLVVFSPNSDMEYWMLLAIEKPKFLKEYRISSKKPGTYQVSCGDTKQPCKNDDQFISIRTKAIVINENVFLWNKGQSKFIKLPSVS